MLQIIIQICSFYAPVLLLYINISLKDITNRLSAENTRSPSHFNYMQWCLVVLDAIKSKLYSPVPQKSKENLQKIFDTHNFLIKQLSC